MTIARFLLVVALVMLSAVPCCLLAVKLERHFPGKDYDERQKISRGKAYRCSYIVGQVYYFFVIFAEISRIGGNGLGIETALLLYIGFVLQAMVFHTYCLLTHADLPLSGKPRSTIFNFAVCAVINLAPVWFPGAYQGFSDPLQLTGQFSAGLLFVVNGVFFAYLTVLHIIQYLRDRKEK